MYFCNSCPCLNALVCEIKCIYLFNTVGGSCYSAHQAVSNFAEHHIDMVSCPTRAGVSGCINRWFECVTITDSKFSNRELVLVKRTSINGATIWHEQLDFCLHRYKWDLPDQHIANCILPSELLFPISLSSRQSAVMKCQRKWNSSTKLNSPFPSLTVVEYWLWVCFGRTSIHTVFLCCIQCHEVQPMRDMPPRVSEQQLPWAQVTPYHLHNSVYLPRCLGH